MNSNTALNGTYASGYCQYRLPCGYCEKLGRDCPKQGTAYGGVTTQQFLATGIGHTTGTTVTSLDYERVVTTAHNVTKAEG